MNKNVALEWNTILSAFGWFDIRDLSGPGNGTGGGGGQPYPNPTNPSPEVVLMTKIFANVLAIDCRKSPDPTPVELPAAKVTALYQNEPNPFNPTTRIRFDLARDDWATMRIFDVAGHVVRRLVQEPKRAGRNQVIWNGLGEAGHQVASGVYFYRLEAGDFWATRKLLVLR